MDDPQSGELPCERWNPTQSVRTILLSVISLLNEPNTFSPANVDASVMYRRWRESKGRDKEYENIIRLVYGSPCSFYMCAMAPIVSMSNELYHWLLFSRVLLLKTLLWW